MRRGVLAATLSSPEKWWYLSELAHHLRNYALQPPARGSHAREVGVLDERRERAGTYFRANRASPLYWRLRAIFEKAAAGVPPNNEEVAALESLSSRPLVSHVLMSRYNREELYDEVWSQPLQRLAGKHALSDVGLAKVCRKLHIPSPGKGYWSKKSAGKHPPCSPALLPESCLPMPTPEPR